MKEIAQCVAACLLGLLLSSCGSATAALVILLGLKGGSDGGSSPTLVSDVLPVQGSLGLKVSPLSFTFRLTDPESDPADVEVFYALAGSTDLKPVLLTGNANLNGLATGPGGVEHLRQWEFSAQLPGGDGLAEGVQLVVRLKDGSSRSASAPFDAGNDPPQLTIASAPSGEVSAVVGVDLLLVDSSGDLVNVDAQYEDLDAPGTPRQATTLGVNLQGIAALPGGTTVRFLWDVEADEPGREFRAKLTFTPSDDVGAGTSIETGVLTIDNNAAPILIVDGSAFFANPDQRRGIPLPFSVLDDEGDAVQVVFQWRRPDEAFPSLPADPAELAVVLSSTEERQARHIATQLPRTYQGSLVPVSASSVRLLELGALAAGLTSEFTVGRELEVLRLPGPPAGIVGGWSGSGPVGPRAALPFEDGDSALILDGPSPGNWRVQEVHLATGAVLRAIAGGGEGDPDAMAYQPARTSLLLAVASANRGANSLTLFLQSGGGVFPSTPSVVLAGHHGPVQPAHLAVGDMNGDGEEDLAAVTGSNELDVFVFNSGSGGYSDDPLVLGEGDLNGPARAVADDLNGDGLNDFAVANSSDNDIVLFFQDARGTFSGAEPDLVLGSALDTPGVEGVAAADLDGDGDLDLVMANPESGTLTVYSQFGPGTFGSTPSHTLGDSDTAGAGSVDAADLNGDGRVDVVSANAVAGGLALFFQESGGSLPESPDLVLGGGTLSIPVSARAADLDGDGDFDLVSADAGADNLAIFHQGAAGVFGSLPDLLLGGAATTRGPAMVASRPSSTIPRAPGRRRPSAWSSAGRPSVARRAPSATATPSGTKRAPRSSTTTRPTRASTVTSFVTRRAQRRWPSCAVSSARAGAPPRPLSLRTRADSPLRT